MKTGYKDRFGKDICLGHNIRPYHDGDYGRLAIVKSSDSGYYVDIPDYFPLHDDEVKLENYLDGEDGFWEFEIVD